MFGEISLPIEGRGNPAQHAAVQEFLLDCPPLSITPTSFRSLNGVDWVPGAVGPGGDTAERPQCELASAEDIVLATSDVLGPITLEGLGVTVSTNNGATWCCQFKGWEMV